MIVGYARESTKKQGETPLEQQVYRLRTEGGVDEILMDIGSGDDDARPNFERLLEMVKRREVAAVVVTRDDRITRRGVTALDLYQLFEKSGVELRILDDGNKAIDWDNPYEWERRANAAIRSEYERRMLILRVKQGMKFMRHQGKTNGKYPFGYRRIKGQYELDPQTKEIAQYTVEVALSASNLGEVAQLVFEKYGKRWDRTCLRRWLVNPVLRGKTGWCVAGDEVPNGSWSERHTYRRIEDTHPDHVILTEEQLQLLLKKFDENKRLWGKNRDAIRYPLGGLCVCSECGEKLVINRDRKYFYINHRSGGLAREHRGSNCRGCLRMEVVESAVVAALKERAEVLATAALVPSEIVESPELIERKNQLRSLKAIPGNNPAIAEAIVELEGQISRLETSLIVQSETDGSRKQKLLDLMQTQDYWEVYSQEEKRKIYQLLVERVFIKNRQVASVKLRV